MKRLLLILCHPIWWWQARQWKRQSHTKVELLRGLGSRNPFLAHCAQHAFASIISGPILEVIENAPVMANLFPAGVETPSIPLSYCYGDPFEHENPHDVWDGPWERGSWIPAGSHGFGAQDVLEREAINAGGKPTAVGYAWVRLWDNAEQRWRELTAEERARLEGA